MVIQVETESVAGNRRRNEIVLIRHGETEWSSAGRFAGRTDLPLVEAGEAAVVAARGKLQSLEFDRVVASPLQRAVRTAQLLGFLTPDRDPRLLERDYGDYEGMTTSEIRDRVPGWEVWADPLPRGEAIDAMTNRVDSFIADFREGEPKLTLAVAHAHLIRLFTARWLGLPPLQARLFRLGTLGLVHLGWERDTPAMHKWNA